MAESMKSKETMTMSPQTSSARSVRPSRGLRAALALTASLAAMAAIVVPAQAKQPISFFEISTSNTDAGGHPDIQTRFTLPGAGEPEVAKTISAEWPTGIFGNPQAVPRCSNVDFALNECPSYSQVGWIGVQGNYEGDPFHMFGSGPLYDMEPAGENETARFQFTVPGVDIPITIPINVRTGSDYGLTLNVTGITQQIPLRAPTSRSGDSRRPRQTKNSGSRSGNRDRPPAVSAKCRPTPENAPTSRSGRHPGSWSGR